MISSLSSSLSSSSSCVLAIDSKILVLLPAVFLAAAFQLSVWRKSSAYLQTAYSDLHMGFFPLEQTITFWGIQGSSILPVWPTHCSLFRCKNVRSSISSYNLYTSSHLIFCTLSACVGPDICLRIFRHPSFWQLSGSKYWPVLLYLLDCKTSKCKLTADF
jgi:hypothetical protein